MSEREPRDLSLEELTSIMTQKASGAEISDYRNAYLDTQTTELRNQMLQASKELLGRLCTLLQS
jgi:hypothetical protein